MWEWDNGRSELDSTSLHSPPCSFWRVFQGQAVRNAHYLICMYNVNMHIFICSLHLQGTCWHQNSHACSQQSFLVKGKEKAQRDCCSLLCKRVYKACPTHTFTFGLKIWDGLGSLKGAGPLAELENQCGRGKRRNITWPTLNHNLNQFLQHSKNLKK